MSNLRIPGSPNFEAHWRRFVFLARGHRSGGGDVMSLLVILLLVLLVLALFGGVGYYRR